MHLLFLNIFFIKIIKRKKKIRIGNQRKRCFHFIHRCIITTASESFYSYHSKYHYWPFYWFYHGFYIAFLRKKASFKVKRLKCNRYNRAEYNGLTGSWKSQFSQRFYFIFQRFIWMAVWNNFELSSRLVADFLKFILG